MSKMSWREFKERVKRAPKKNRIWAIGCFVACLALAAWFIVTIIHLI